MLTLPRFGLSARTLLGVALATTASAGASIAWEPPAPTPPPPAESSTPATPKQPAREGGREGGRDGQRRGGDGRPGGAASISVEGAMKMMARAQRILKDQISDASMRDENLKLITDMQRGCVLAKSQELPAELLESGAFDKPKTDSDRQAMRETYASGLRALLRELVELEQSVVDNKLDEAAKHFARVGELEAQTHEALGMK
jgi:hypothetical protein